MLSLSSAFSGRLDQCAAGRETGDIWISASQPAFYQDRSLTQHWTEPCLLSGAYTHRALFLHRYFITSNQQNSQSLYFSVCMSQVLDVCPLPGMMVSPSDGVVPSGGQAVVNIHFYPDSVIRFDTRIEVRERKRGGGWKELIYAKHVCLCYR